MEPNYSPVYPHGEVDASIKAFISHFYHVSDDPDQDAAWVEFFDSDATVIMGAQTGRGRHGASLFGQQCPIRILTAFAMLEITSLRRGMWRTVAKRRHRVDKVFPAAFGRDGVVEYMLIGSVARESKTGEAQIVDWAGHARLKGDGRGRWKLEFYRVYM